MSDEKRPAVKVIGLLSGGLDSTLATRIMQKLGFDIVALNFSSPFCTCTTKSHGCKNEAKRLGDELGIRVRVEFMGTDYLDMLRSPQFGYGSGMNPCIDCRIMVFKRAKEIMIEEGAEFIFTGEVSGQRPMSQKRDRMRMIEKQAGLEGLVVRPLSAKLLEPTIPEKNGIIDREKMLEIHGRSRKEQIRIAKDEFGMTENLCSSGGCLLTDQHFAGRIRDLIDYDESPGVKDARLLRVGRHFRLSEESKLIVGRNHDENEQLEKMAGAKDFLFYPMDVKGPLAIFRGVLSGESRDLAGSVTARYSEKSNGDPIKIKYHKKNEDESWSVDSEPANEELLDRIRI